MAPKLVFCIFSPTFVRMARAAVSSAVGANGRVWRPGPRTPPLTADEARRGGFMVGGTYVPPVPPTPTWNGGFGGGAAAEREEGELSDSEEEEDDDGLGMGLFD